MALTRGVGASKWKRFHLLPHTGGAMPDDSTKRALRRRYDRRQRTRAVRVALGAFDGNQELTAMH
jgi:hypothetical protein